VPGGGRLCRVRVGVRVHERIGQVAAGRLVCIERVQRDHDTREEEKYHRADQ
jgi:hypothetical protein